MFDERRCLSEWNGKEMKIDFNVNDTQQSTWMALWAQTAQIWWFDHVRSLSRAFEWLPHAHTLSVTRGGKGRVIELKLENFTTATSFYIISRDYLLRLKCEKTHRAQNSSIGLRRERFHHKLSRVRVERPCRPSQPYITRVMRKSFKINNTKSLHRIN